MAACSGGGSSSHDADRDHDIDKGAAFENLGDRLYSSVLII